MLWITAGAPKAHCNAQLHKMLMISAQPWCNLTNNEALLRYLEPENIAQNGVIDGEKCDTSEQGTDHHESK